MAVLSTQGYVGNPTNLVSTPYTPKRIFFRTVGSLTEIFAG